MVRLRYLPDGPEDRIMRALKILSSDRPHEESVFGDYHSAHEIADKARTSADKVREVLGQKLGNACGLKVISVGNELAWRIDGGPRLVH